MTFKRLIAVSAATLAVAVAGTVAAAPQEGPGTPKSVENPVLDPAKQVKTEQILKGQEKALTGDQGNEISSKVKQPTPDPEGQAKTQEMLDKMEPAVENR